MPTPSPAPPDLHVPIGKLPGLIPELTALLVTPELDETKARGLLTERLTVTCPECNTLVSGAELNQLAMDCAANGPTDRKLKRLSKGYCAGIGCEAAHYKVSIDQRPGEDWQKIIAALQGQPTSEETSAIARERKIEAAKKRKETMIRVAIGIAILLIVLLIKYRRDGGYIPVLEKEHKYQVAPDSVQPPVIPRKQP